MKRIYRIRTVLSLLALTAVMACSESYPSMMYDQPKTTVSDLNKDEIDQRSEVLLFVNPQDLFTVTTRSGMGSFPPADPDNFKNGTIYVYAFRDGKNDTGNELTNYADLTRSAYAKTNGTANDPNMADCLVDGPDYHLGLPTHIVAGAAGELKYGKNLQYEDGYTGYDTETDYTCFYSNRYQETPYNFFAFYMDDMDALTTARPHRGKDSIWYENVEIDGRRDIMCGMAPPLGQIVEGGKTVLDDRYPTQSKKLSENDRNMLLSYGYSKYAADRNIHPSIDMKHQLTQLRFFIYPADSTCDDVVVENIAISSKYKADFTVATQKPADHQPRLWFKPDKQFLSVYLLDSPDYQQYTDEVGGVRTGYNVSYDKATMDGTGWKDRPNKQVGEGIIVAPDSVYEMLIDYSVKLRTKDEGPKQWVTQQHSLKTLKLSESKEGNIFQPGKFYNIYVAVYGNREIQVYTSLEDWKQADETPNVDIGNEQGWED